VTLPNPTDRNPLILPGGLADPATVFLNQVIDHPNFELGDYTYANDMRLPQDWAAQLAPYLYAGAPEKLRIGRFCQIAQGVQFITATANHPMQGISTYPFAIFDAQRIASYRATLPDGGDNVVGHDCWIGRGATLMPGSVLGNGVIVGAGAVVTGSVPDYAIVAGNPARIVRMRFAADDIAALNRICWWNWQADRIELAIAAIEAADISVLLRF
jgi:virginiamycin A acetyltransferase